jgi:spore coat protein A, manganese oxidase
MNGAMSRRTVLGLFGAAAAVGVGVPLLGGIGGASSTGTLLRSERPLPRPFTRPLTIPPVLEPTGRTATTDLYDITQRRADAQILDDVLTPIWGYNGKFPGPTIVARRGRAAVVRHRNELAVPTVVHLHGGHTSPEHDGFPIDLLLPVGVDSVMGHNPHLAGGAFAHGEREYVYPSEQRAATLWYHDHRMDFTGPSVWRGLAGFHLIHDDEEDALGLPSGERDLPLMLVDRSFAADGTLRYPSLDPQLTHMAGVAEPYTVGVLGDVVLVNGVPWPVADVSAVRYRLRMLNASNARRFRLALDPQPAGGGALVQIASDGGLLNGPIPHDAIELAPAQRCDVIVDFGRYRRGQEVALVNEFGDGSTAQVMRFRVGSREPDSSRVPDVLSSVEALDPAAAAVTRTFAFRAGSVGTMRGWTINGRPFDPDRADADPRLGEVEVWRLVSDFHHPFHLHLAQFQVLSRGAGGPGPYDAGWKDTLDLRPGELATVIMRFTGFAGRYVFHCHNLEHEDMAMMGTLVTRE